MPTLPSPLDWWKCELPAGKCWTVPCKRLFSSSKTRADYSLVRMIYEKTILTKTVINTVSKSDGNKTLTVGLGVFIRLRAVSRPSYHNTLPISVPDDIQVNDLSHSKDVKELPRRRSRSIGGGRRCFNIDASALRNVRKSQSITLK